MLFHSIIITRFHRCYESSVRFTSGLGNNNDENAFLRSSGIALLFNLRLSAIKLDFVSKVK